MKFVYEYRTSDNVRHEGVVAASSREAAFSALKAQGIRPGSVREAPGLFNKLLGKGKRWIAIVVLAVLCVALAIAVWRVVLNAPQPSLVVEALDSPIRRQIIGDAAVIEKGLKTGWADVFADEGDRFLASFAIPGYEAAVRNTTEDEIRKVMSSSRSRLVRGEGLEARQIIAIVGGIKDELRRFLAKRGTIREYCQRLAERQDLEISYYLRAKTEVEEARRRGMSGRKLDAFWESHNEGLRQMGIRLVAMPE